MKNRNAQHDNGKPSPNLFGIQLEEPMQQMAIPSVCEMKPYLGEDSRWMSTVPEGG